MAIGNWMSVIADLVSLHFCAPHLRWIDGCDECDENQSHVSPMLVPLVGNELAPIGYCLFVVNRKPRFLSLTVSLMLLGAHAHTPFLFLFFFVEKTVFSRLSRVYFQLTCLDWGLKLLFLQFLKRFCLDSCSHLHRISFERVYATHTHTQNDGTIICSFCPHATHTKNYSCQISEIWSPPSIECLKASIGPNTTTFVCMQCARLRPPRNRELLAIYICFDDSTTSACWSKLVTFQCIRMLA